MVAFLKTCARPHTPGVCVFCLISAVRSTTVLSSRHTLGQMGVACMLTLCVAVFGMQFSQALGANIKAGVRDRLLETIHLVLVKRPYRATAGPVAECARAAATLAAPGDAKEQETLCILALHTLATFDLEHSHMLRSAWVWNMGGREGMHPTSQGAPRAGRGSSSRQLRGSPTHIRP